MLPASVKQEEVKNTGKLKIQLKFDKKLQHHPYGALNNNGKP